MLTLAAPWMLLLIIIPPLYRALFPKAADITPGAIKIPFFQAMQKIPINLGKTAHEKKHLAFFTLLWFLLTVAAAGPQWVGEPIPQERAGRNIMLVLDLSGSMELNDMLINGQPVSRLTLVKDTARAFVKQRNGDRVGLILFGSQAYLQTPLTYDLQNVLQRLDDATVGLAGKNTAIGDGLGLAIKRLEDVPEKSRVIILLTDGANNAGVIEPERAAELARMEHIKVYTIGLGSESNAQLMANPFFNMANASLDEKTLEKIANITGGRYFRATDAQSLQNIYTIINQLEAVKQEESNYRPRYDYYPWPLGIALLLFLLWLSRSIYRWPFKKSAQREVP